MSLKDLWRSAALAAISILPLSPIRYVAADDAPVVTDDNKACVDCHRRSGAALVMEWEHSRHAADGIGCIDCHGANEGEVDAWKHQGRFVSALVTPKDCS